MFQRDTRAHPHCLYQDLIHLEPVWISELRLKNIFVFAAVASAHNTTNLFITGQQNKSTNLLHHPHPRDGFYSTDSKQTQPHTLSESPPSPPSERTALCFFAESSCKEVKQSHVHSMNESTAWNTECTVHCTGIWFVYLWGSAQFCSKAHPKIK